MIFLASQVFVSQTLLAFGPFLPFVLIGIAAGLCWLVMWLLEEPAPFRDHEGNVVGTRPRRKIWRVTLAWLIVGYLVAVALSALGLIR